MSALPPPANWYDDPYDPSVERWWDGANWTAHTRPRPAATPQTTPQAASQAAAQAASQVAPGWYDDPQAPGMQRWWDGSSWTSYVQPAPGPQPSAVVPQRFERARPAGGSSWLSTRNLLIAVAAVGALLVAGTLVAVAGGSDDERVPAVVDGGGDRPSDVPQVQFDYAGLTVLVDGGIADRIAARCGSFSVAQSDFLRSASAGSVSTYAELRDFLTAWTVALDEYSALLDEIGTLEGRSIDGAPVTFGFSERAATAARVRQEAAAFREVIAAISAPDANSDPDMDFARLGYGDYAGFTDHVLAVGNWLDGTIVSDGVGVMYVASVMPDCAAALSQTAG